VEDPCAKADFDRQQNKANRRYKNSQSGIASNTFLFIGSLPTGLQHAAKLP